MCVCNKSLGPCRRLSFGAVGHVSWSVAASFKERLETTDLRLSPPVPTLPSLPPRTGTSRTGVPSRERRLLPASWLHERTALEKPCPCGSSDLPALCPLGVPIRKHDFFPLPSVVSCTSVSACPSLRGAPSTLPQGSAVRPTAADLGRISPRHTGSLRLCPGEGTSPQASRGRPWAKAA